MTEHNKNIKSKILQTIEAGKVKMRPKWHFVLKGALLILGLLILSLALLYLVSFLLFVNLHEHWIFPRLISIPILLILLVVIFIALLEFLVRKYSFGYKEPLLYTALGIVILVLLGGSVIARTPVHPRYSGPLYRNLDRHGLIRHVPGRMPPPFYIR